MKKIFHCLILFIGLFSLNIATLEASGITKYEPLNAAAFWQKQNPHGNDIILDANGINRLNKSIIEQTSTVVDLANYPKSQSSNIVKATVNERLKLLNDGLYVNGSLLSANYKEIIRQEANLNSLNQYINVRYGVVTCRSNLRALPTNEGWFQYASDKNFDQLQETAVDPGEPVVILHQSKSGNFLFVQMRNYRGWLPTWQVAETNRTKWLEYVQPEQFLVVTANLYTVKVNNSNILYQMGSKIPVRRISEQDYTIVIPLRDGQGFLVETTTVVPASNNLNVGFLPYTSNNLLQQAFRFIHDTYGWGGLKNSVDCSSFIANIYRTVGVELPRDADDQELTAGRRYSFSNMNESGRKAILSSLQPGDVLFFEGHTMMYIGHTQNTPFVIHALGSHYINGQKQVILQVVVSDLELRRYSGSTYLNTLRNAMSYK